MVNLATSEGLPRPWSEGCRDCVMVRSLRAGSMLSGQGDNDLGDRKEAFLLLLDWTGNGHALRKIIASLACDVSEGQVWRALAG